MKSDVYTFKNMTKGFKDSLQSVQKCVTNTLFPLIIVLSTYLIARPGPILGK